MSPSSLSSLPSSHGEKNPSSPKPSVLTTFLSSFKPAPPISPRLDTRLSRRLHSRHLQTLAIGGSIGTGLFVGTGSSLAAAGPGSLLIAFTLIGLMLYCTMNALGELATLYPVEGGFAEYSGRFLDRAWGFAMGWNYAVGWCVTLPLELIAASLVVGFWDGERRVDPAVYVTIFFILIIIINLFGVKGYGESEFVFSMIKVIAVIGFIILGICIDVGASPSGEYIGGRYWHNPGSFVNGFKGLCSVFVTAAFAFSGTELVGLAAAETANPRKTLPTAIKQVFWRILLFYIISIIVIGCLVPYTSPSLLTGLSSADTNASPFVIAIKSAGITGLPSVMNAVILVAVLSVGNSSVYGSSRIIASLAERGQAPRVLAYVDQAGRPLMATVFTLGWGVLAYFVAASDEVRTEAFNWLLAVSGLSSLFTWGSICLCHIRFRAAWKAQGHSLSELVFRSQLGVVGSWVGFVFNVLVLVATFWISVWPSGYAEYTARERVETFFMWYLSVPIVVVSYVGWKVVKKTKIVRSSEADLVTGIKDLNLAELVEEEKRERQKWSPAKRVYKFFC